MSLEMNLEMNLEKVALKVALKAVREIMQLDKSIGFPRVSLVEFDDNLTTMPSKIDGFCACQSMFT